MSDERFTATLKETREHSVARASSSPGDGPALAEAAMRVAQETFRELVAISPFGLCIVDADFRVYQVSEGSQKMFENVHPLLGRDLAEVLRIVWPEPFASEAIARFRHTLDTGDPYHASPVIERRRDISELQSYDWKVERLRLPDGRFGVVCHFYDLSERQRYDEALREREAALRQSEERFRQLANAMPQLVWTATSDGRVTYYNSQATRYGGIERNADGRWTWQPVVHPDDQAATWEAWQRGVESGCSYECEHRLCMADGSYRWHLSRAYAAGPSDSVQWFGTATDVHELKQAQQRFRESEELFREMADTAPAMLWITDANHRGAFLSRGWYEFTGQSEAQGLGFGWLDAVHPDDRHRVSQTFLDAAARQKSFAVDYRVRSASGEYRWAVDAGRPRFDAEGNFVGYIGSVIDAHERKQAEHELERLNAELRAADQRKDDFLATLSHELRNPLAPLRTGLELMALAKGDAGKLERARATMERQMVQLVRLVDDLLDMSRITRDRLDLKRERSDLVAILRQSLENSRPLVDHARHTLTVELPPAPLVVDADPVRLTQVFGNLLTNACKYTEPGGRIFISAERHRHEATVTVRDTGIGIRSDLLPRVFDLFMQGERALERSAGGLGIGLALVKRLVEMHGGAVTAESEGPGRGSAFVVRLPLLE